jgi:hypothetical protein
MATRFFPPASSLHGDDYLEFAFRFNILPADTEYPAAGEKISPRILPLVRKISAR